MASEVQAAATMPPRRPPPSRALGLLAVASVAVACAGASGDPDLCDLAAAQVEDCFGAAPEGFAAWCAEDADRHAAWQGWTCEELEAAGSKGEAPAAPLGLGAPCLWNVECEGSLVCRAEAAGELLGRCAEPGSRESELAADRACDPVTDDDCVEGDRCQGLAGRAGTCEADRLGAPCECAYGAELCGGERAGCGGGLVCVQSVCRRPCRSAVPGTCPALADVCAQQTGSRGESLGSFCHARL